VGRACDGDGVGRASACMQAGRTCGTRNIPERD
jgi:hypothetical protein